MCKKRVKSIRMEGVTERSSHNGLNSSLYTGKFCFLFGRLLIIFEINFFPKNLSHIPSVSNFLGPD